VQDRQQTVHSDPDKWPPEEEGDWFLLEVGAPLLYYGFPMSYSSLELPCSLYLPPTCINVDALRISGHKQVARELPFIISVVARWLLRLNKDYLLHM
jgi:hypothetical protein